MAAERVRGELDCLLSLPEGTPLLQQAWEDGLLDTWLPRVKAAQLKQLQAIDQTAARLHERWPDYSALLQGWIKEKTTPGLHRSWLKATKLSQILPDDLDQAESCLVNLKYSRAEQQAVISVLMGWQYFQAAVVRGPLSARQQYHLFKLTGAGFVGVALLGLAQGLPERVMVPLMERYLTPHDPVAHPQALISGRDLIQVLGLKPGPRIGELLEAV